MGKGLPPWELKADGTGSFELSLALQKTELNSTSPITLWYLLFSSAWSARLLSNQRAQKMSPQCAKVCSSPHEPKGDGHASVYHSVIHILLPSSWLYTHGPLALREPLLNQGYSTATVPRFQGDPGFPHCGVWDVEQSRCPPVWSLSVCQALLPAQGLDSCKTPEDRRK